MALTQKAEVFIKVNYDARTFVLSFKDALNTLTNTTLASNDYWTKSGTTSPITLTYNKFYGTVSALLKEVGEALKEAGYYKVSGERYSGNTLIEFDLFID